mgnify:CR=1 FL=1
MTVPRDEPPALKWVARFIDSMNRATDGAIYSWELSSRTDPLQWVLTVTLARDWLRAEKAPMRNQLRVWAATNNVEYQRSEWKKRVFRSLLLLRGLRPESNLSPFEEEDDLHRGRRGRLRRPGRAYRRGGRYDASTPSDE